MASRLALTVTSHDAEMVSCWIGHNHPAAAIGVPPVGHLGRPECKDALDLLIPAAIGRGEIKVDTSSGSAQFIDLAEKQPIVSAAVGDDTFLVTRLVRIALDIDVVENRLPPLAQFVGVGAVNDGVRNARSHGVDDRSASSGPGAFLGVAAHDRPTVELRAIRWRQERRGFPDVGCDAVAVSDELWVALDEQLTV